MILLVLLLATSTVRVEAYSYSTFVTWRQVEFIDDFGNPLPSKIIKEVVTSDRHKSVMTFKVEGIPATAKFYAARGTTRKDEIFARIWVNSRLVFSDTFYFEEEQ